MICSSYMYIMYTFFVLLSESLSPPSPPDLSDLFLLNHSMSAQRCPKLRSCKLIKLNLNWRIEKNKLVFKTRPTIWKVLPDRFFYLLFFQKGSMWGLEIKKLQNCSTNSTTYNYLIIEYCTVCV